MAKTILVPTDLQVGSLNALKAAIAESGNDGVNAILMHAVHPPDGITDLLFHSPKRALRARMGPAFHEALAVLRNHFEQRLISMHVVPFHGNTQKAFDEFLKTKGVDEVHISGTYTMRKHERAMDPLPFIRRSQCHVVEHGQPIPAELTRAHPSLDHLQLLFER